MKNVLAISIIITLFFSCKSDRLTNLEKREHEKLYPYLNQYFEKNFPDEQIDFDAYIEAKLAINQEINAKGGNGFDDDWATQGPGNIGARINTVAVDPNDNNTIYVGYGEGGVFKTSDGGLNWRSIFDDQAFLAIGDIVIDPNNTDVIYVGTGDVNISGFPHIGNGLFKSSDGGETWTNLGLEEQRIISKIELHPTDPNTMYVASMGLPFTYNDTRGLFKTTDGGSSWEKIFYISDSTGVIDVIVNPEDPNIVLASGWDRVRSNSVNLVSGDGADFYISTDAGNTFNKIEGNLPDGRLCRTGLTVCKNFPNNVYAVVVDANRRLEGLYRSQDYGMTFDSISTISLKDYTDDPFNGFGWYFGKIRVNPDNPDHIFVLGVDMYGTLDGGLTWEPTTPIWWTYEVHADKHDLVFGQNGDMFLGTDGGLYKSNINNLDTWEDIENIPTTQFYKVAYAPFNPFNYYGGAQDNGTTGGNNDAINDWPRIYGGDGFQAVFSNVDPFHFYVETQNGGLAFTTDFGESFQNGDFGIEEPVDWSMPYLMSPHDQTIMYAGTDRVMINFDSYDPEWVPYSPKLTSDALVGGSPANITTLSESTLETGLLYVGTNDGLVYVGENGVNFNLISEDLPLRYVTCVMASPDFIDKAYVSFSGYKDNDNSPRIFRTDDRGTTWTDIASDLPDIAINNLLVIPNTEDKLIFVATDAGVYGSKDAGDSWLRVGSNMPNIIVADLKFNPETKEVVAGTYGKSIMTYNIEELLEPISTSDVQYLKRNIKLFPNPVIDRVNIQIEQIEISNDYTIDIIDVNGTLISSIPPISVNELQLDFSDYNTGMYYLRFNLNGKVISKSLFKI